MKNILLSIVFLSLVYASPAQKNLREYLLEGQYEQPELLKHKYREFKKQQLVQEHLKEQQFLKARNEKLLKNAKQQKNSPKVAMNAEDRAVLETFYNATGGDNWWHNTYWLTGDGSDWFGITLDENGRVTEINLDYNQLSGSIPAELGNLPNLQVLDLTNNQFSGSIPAELGNLTNLTYLYLGYNQLSGSIPVELGNLTNLENLELDNNQLSGSIPVELGNLTNLQGLYLYSNQLSDSIPAELGNLTNLTYLYLGYNQLSGSIPYELGNLTNLQRFFLESNQLNGSIPAELGNLTNLTNLYLSFNQLSGSIPAELGNLTNLQRFFLESNQLSGSIPAEIGNLTNLQDLFLESNQLSGSIPYELGNLTNLTNLFLNNNQLTSLPDLSVLVNLSSWSIKVQNNLLDFGDLENSGISWWHYYAPQGKVGTEQNIELSEGENTTISVSVAGSNNSYQWYIDGYVIFTATESEYTISNFIETRDAGVYVCKITDSNYPYLTLESNNITVSGTSKVIDANDNSQFSIYPNPVSDRLTVHFSKEKAEMLIVSDVTGKRIFSSKVNSETESVNLSNLGSGIYILQLKFENQIISKKIIKN